MLKKLLVVLLVLSIGPAAFAFKEADVDTTPQGVVYTGPVQKDGEWVDQYEITAHGRDIWNNADDFYFMYQEVTGDIRIAADFEWVGDVGNTWAKMGTMLRNDTSGASVHYSTVFRKDMELHAQQRTSTGAGSQGPASNGDRNYNRIGIQRMQSNGFNLIERLYYQDDQWKSLGIWTAPNLNDTVLAGIAVTSHQVDNSATARVTDIAYDGAPELVGSLPTVSAGSSLGDEPCSDTPGFIIRQKSRDLSQDAWGYAQMNELLDDPSLGSPFPALIPEGIITTETKRIAPVVNMNDGGGGGNHNPNDSFYGPDKMNIGGVAGGGAQGDDDDDNDFATEAVACIYLTEGLHVIGSASDDGTQFEIGDASFQTGEWKGDSSVDFLIQVEADGWYDFRARHLEGGGGAALELYERMPDGSTVLLGDVANGGPAVYIPEPATIALLGLGGLSLLRRKRS